MSVAEAVTRELAKLSDDLAESTLAATALSLAEDLDGVIRPCEHCGEPTSFKNSASARAMVAKEIREVIAALYALAPARDEQEDEIERARKRRAERLAGQSAAGASSPS